MFFALTGRPPFEAANLPALLAKHVSEAPPALLAVRPEAPARLAEIVDRLLRKAPAERFASGEELSTAVDAVRGRDMRAPPLVRGFMRNAQVSTMVFLAASVAGQGITVNTGGSVSVSASGPGVIGLILLIQLVIVARRLLREGYAFADIRTALLAEAQAQEEEADAARHGKWLRRLDSVWQRIWAGRFGRWFFKLAGMGIRPPDRPALPSADHTELVLGRSVVDAYTDLTAEQRAAAPGLPDVVERLEARAASLRARGQTGPALTDTVAALENVRLALLRLRSGAGNVQDLTAWLERAREIGHRVDARIEAEHLASRRPG
jgi:hypothetical protein